MVEKILRKAKEKADAAEVFFLSKSENPVKFTQGRLHSIEKKEIQGVGLRIFKDGRLGYSSTNKLDDVDKLVNNALESARFGRKVDIELPSNIKMPERNIWFDKKTEEFSIDKAVEEGKKYIELVNSKYDDVKMEVQINGGYTNVSILNSFGLNISYKKTFFYYYAEGFTVLNNSFIWLLKGTALSRLNYDTENFAAEIIKQRSMINKEVEIKTGKMDIIFMPSAVSTFLDAFTTGANGKLVLKGNSPLINRIGEEMLDKRVSIIDDPTIPFGADTQPFDDEGTPANKKYLFENGILKNFYVDIETGKLLNISPMGNGMRNYTTPPSPSTTNIYVAPGDTSLKDIIKDTKEGLIIYGVLGGGQSNILAGDFSVNVSLGFYIRNGEIQGRVKNVMIGDNAYQMIKKLKCISDKTEEVFGLYTPAFAFKDMKVATK